MRRGRMKSRGDMAGRRTATGKGASSSVPMQAAVHAFLTSLFLNITIKSLLMAQNSGVIRESHVYPWHFRDLQITGISVFLVMDILLLSVYAAVCFLFLRMFFKMSRRISYAFVALPVFIYLFYVLPAYHNAVELHWRHFLLGLPAYFYQDLVFSAVLAGLIYLVFRLNYLLRMPDQVSWFVSLSVQGGVWAYLILNYHIYGNFGTNLSIGVVQLIGNMADLSSSFKEYLTPGAVMSLFLFIPVFFISRRWVVKRYAEIAKAPGIIRIGLVSALALFVGISAVFHWLEKYSEGLEMNPMAQMARGLPGLILGETWFAHARDTESIQPSSLSVLYPAGRDGRIESDVNFKTDLSGAAEGMNVILVVLESTGVNYLQVYGHSEPTTPEMEKLKDHMLLFENYYTITPSSMQSLFPIFCSMYPPLKMLTQVNPHITCASISEILTAEGYSATLFHSGKFAFNRKKAFFSHRGFDVLYDAESMPGRTGYYRNSWGIDERATVKAMFDWLDHNSEQPFFITYIPVFPHHPYDVPEEQFVVFGRESPLEKYKNSLAYMDRMIGDLYRALEERSLAENTLLIIVGDHGEAFGEHENNYIHALRVYEENIKVPFMIINKTLIGEPHKIDTLGNHIDLTPIFSNLSLAGPSSGKTTMGVNLLRSRYFSRR